MTAQENQEGQKTVVAFIAGLLIGGLLVWVFSDAPTEVVDDVDASDSETSELVESNDDNSDDSATSAEETDDSDNGVVVAAPEMVTGEGSIEVANQSAGFAVSIDGAEFPNDEGWIGVRDYTDGQLTGLLGVARFSKEQGLIPAEIELQRATVAGNQYAVVFYTESGDRSFSLANDVQIENVWETFTAK